MKSYGLTKFAAADGDVAGLQAQGAPTRDGSLRGRAIQTSKSKSSSRRYFKRLARKAGKAECQPWNW
jgi:hypothetical protein